MNAARRPLTFAAWIALASAASFAYFVLLHRGFTLLTYPFKFPDSWVWLVEARSYLGDDVIPAILAPVTPLTFAALMKLGMADLIPYRALFFHHLLPTIVFAWTYSGTRSARTALVAGLLCLTNASMLGNALYVGSDVAANALLLLAVFAFWLGMTRSRAWLWGAAIAMGISANTQYAAFFLPATFGAYVVLRERRRLLDSHVWGSLGLGIALAGGQFLYRRLVFGTWLASRASHVSLVHPHADSIGTYTWWSIGFFSLPILLLALLGLWEVISTPEWRSWGTLVVLLLLTMVGFFVLLYTWSDNRFIQYWAAPTFMLAAVGMRRLYHDLFNRPEAPSAPVMEPLHRDEAAPAPVEGPSITATVAPGPQTSAVKPPPPAALWLRGLFLAMVAVAFVANSLAKTWPFSNEVVPVPGVGIDLQTTRAATGLRLDLTAKFDRSTHQAFYYAHYRASRRLERTGTALPCTFNDATADLQRLAASVDGRLAPHEAIALGSDAISWHVERHTLSFLTRRAVVPYGGLGKLDDVDGRRVGLVVLNDEAVALAAARELIPPGDKLEVVTLREGEQLTQRLELPAASRAVQVLTGTFDEAGVSLRYSFRRTEQIEPPIAQGVVALKNNDYTVMALAAPNEKSASYYFSLANPGPLPAAVYVNRAVRREGWLLVGPDGAQADGQIVVRAEIADSKLATELALVARSGKYSLWRRASATSAPANPASPAATSRNAGTSPSATISP